MGRATLLLAFAAAGAAAADGVPGPGRYDGQLCVATRPGEAASCGAAEVEVRGARVDVRVADIVYRLALRSSQLDVVTTHGALRIDEFSAPYAWEGKVLTFSDPAKDVRYEVRLPLRPGPDLRPGAPPR